MQHHHLGVVQLFLFKGLQFPAEQDIFVLKGHMWYVSAFFCF